MGALSHSILSTLHFLEALTMVEHSYVLSKLVDIQLPSISAERQCVDRGTG